MPIRKLLLWFHLVAGLVGGIILVLLGVTGAVMVFETPLDHALNANLYRIQPQGAPLSLNALVVRIEQARPGVQVTSLMPSPDEDIATRAMLRGADGKTLTFTVNPYTGDIIGSLGMANNFTQKLHQFHTNLLLGPRGKTITGAGAWLLIVLSLTGIILWWPRKIWKLSDLRPGRQANFDLHNALGFWSSVLLFLFGATGVIIHSDDEIMALIGRLTHTAPTLPVPQPKPVANAKPLGAQELYDAAIKTVPGARVVWIQGIGSTRNAIRVAMRFPEDHTPGGRTNVYLDPATCAVLGVQTSRDAPPGFRLAMFWNRQLHTGDTFGWTSRIVAFLASLALPLLALTGPLIWWGKFKRRRSAAEA